MTHPHDHACAPRVNNGSSHCVGQRRPRWRPNAAASCRRAVAAERGRAMSGGGGRTRHVGRWRSAATARHDAAATARHSEMNHYFLFAIIITIYNYSKRYSVGARLSGRTRYWFGKDAPDGFVGISDLKPLTGTSADQLPHRKSRSLAAA